jgi:WD40 repeat protein
VRALEEVTLRVEGAEDKRPYPGLASFTAHDAEYFFGREAEAEAVWKKLRRANLVAIIGPSGAGKTSFLQAGLIPAQPDDWRHVLCHPGPKPYVAVAQALAVELAGDTDAIRELPRFDEPGVAVSLFKSWRERYGQVLLIVDQFEELFTLNPDEIFAQLLGKLAIEADVHVLLSLRDDFLFYCHAHPALAPIFSELTPLGPPTGPALRRALVQPALTCGYRFEDKRLVDEMLDEVQGERGALPLLAFAASSLWERRDRGSGTLTREAYEGIAGVGGALANHAEATLERIGSAHQTIVRELFRNLVTAQGTRAVRLTDDVLSVCGDQVAAEDVLRQLTDARLLTSFDVADREDTSEKQQQIEIIHESLLTAWPRLRRWQAQDAEGAQLRDQLRQAAQLWEERDRSDDLLWTGTAFREFELWRERYPGGLSATEEAFARSMAARVERQRKRRKRIVGAGFAVLLGVLGVVGSLWRQSVIEARTAEARVLLSLGQQQRETNTTTRIAYAIASLERRDDPAVRRFALEALWRGPAATLVPRTSSSGLISTDFTLDGDRLIVVRIGGSGWDAIPRGGGLPTPINVDQAWNLRAIPEAIRDLDLSLVQVSADRRSAVLVGSTESGWSLHVVQVEQGEIRRLGERRFSGMPPFGKIGNNTTECASISSTGEWIAYAHGNAVDVIRRDDFASGEPHTVGHHGALVLSVDFHPDGQRIASVDETGETRIWSRTSPGRPIRIFRGRPDVFGSIRFDPSGSSVGIPTLHGTAQVWNIEAPQCQDPIEFGWNPTQMSDLEFHPQDGWIVTTNREGAALWPSDGVYARIMRGHTKEIFARCLLYSPDGNSIISASLDGTIRRWDLSGSEEECVRVLLEGRGMPFGIAADNEVRSVLTWGGLGALLISTDSATVRDIPLLEPEGDMVAPHAGAIDAKGQLLAIAMGPWQEDVLFKTQVLQIYDLVTEDTWTINVNADRTIFPLAFTPDGYLVGADGCTLRRWDPRTGQESDPSPRGGLYDLTPYGRFRLAYCDGSLTLYDSEKGSAHDLSLYMDYVAVPDQAFRLRWKHLGG